MSLLSINAIDMFRLGYDVIPITKGEKGCHVNGWQTLKLSEDVIRSWFNILNYEGVGIRTEKNPCIDLDIEDQSVIDALIPKIEEILGTEQLAFRQGQPPRIAILCQIGEEEPLTKVSSTKYDNIGRVEVLAKGQQMVAYHIHPATGEPYRWFDETLQPNVTPSASLPVMTREKANLIIDAFEEICTNLNAKPLRRRAEVREYLDNEDAWVNSAEPVANLTEEGVREVLESLYPKMEDYDYWVKVGFSLWHQFKGSQRGLDLWKEYSAKAPKYDARKCNNKWRSFDDEHYFGRPITFRTLIKQANEERLEKLKRKAVELRDKFYAAANAAEWEDVILECRCLQMNHATLTVIVNAMRETYGRVYDVKKPPTDSKLAAYVSYNGRELPSWLKNWVYVAEGDGYFYNTLTKTEYRDHPFDMVYNNEFSGIANMANHNKASVIAVSTFKIHHADRVMYDPREPEVFTRKGINIVNSFTGRNIPLIPLEYSYREQEAIRTVEEHLVNLFPDEEERSIFTSFLAYNVQMQGYKIKWGVILKGRQGCGKSFFADMMRAVLGIENVFVTTTDAILSKFTSWASGHSLTVVEELKLTGSAGEDAANRLKQYITQDTVPHERKFKESINVPNVTNYLFLTNYDNAIPIQPHERRYYVLSTGFYMPPSSERQRYYRALFSTLSYAGALRRWLMEYQLHPKFSPLEDPPETVSKNMMVRENISATAQVISEELASRQHPFFTSELFDLTAFQQVCPIELRPKSPNGWKRIMGELGLVKVEGRVRLMFLNTYSLHHFYSTNPERWTVNGHPDGAINTALVRDRVDLALRNYNPSSEDDDVFDEDDDL